MLHDNLSLRGMDWGEDFTSEMGGVLTESMSHFQLVKVKIPMLTMTQWGFVHGN